MKQNYHDIFFSRHKISQQKLFQRRRFFFVISSYLNTYRNNITQCNTPIQQRVADIRSQMTHNMPLHSGAKIFRERSHYKETDADRTRKKIRSNMHPARTFLHHIERLHSDRRTRRKDIQIPPPTTGLVPVPQQPGS